MDSAARKSQKHLNGLGELLLRPPTAVPDDELSELAEITELTELWETLSVRGRIPVDWLDDPNRRFELAEVEADGVFLRAAWKSQSGLLAYPPSPWLQLWTAAVLPSFLHAEALAWEACARLHPWGMPKPSGLRWVFTSSWPLRSWWQNGTRWPLQFIVDTIRSVAYSLRGTAELPAGPWGRTQEVPPAHQDCIAAMMWERACSRNYSIPSRKTLTQAVDASLVGRRFREVPNPTEPLIELWRTGFGLEMHPQEDLRLIVRM